MTLGEFKEMVEGCGDDAELTVCTGQIGIDQRAVARLFICRETTERQTTEEIVLKT